jgi:hypothetical protein
MKIFYLNKGGGGFADHVEVEPGTTVGAFFAERMPGRDPHDYLIRVDRQACTEEQVLQEGARVTVTPTKIEGAAAWAAA